MATIVKKQPATKKNKFAINVGKLIIGSNSTSNYKLLNPDINAQLLINEKHRSLGGESGLLGKAIENMGVCPDGKGRYQRFAKGMIYATPHNGAHEVHGKVLEKWSHLGFEKSPLGYPVEDGKYTPGDNFEFQRFEHGMIYWNGHSIAEIHGEIFKTWAALGFERSILGYPISDELDLGVHSGRFNNFQKGQIAWSPLAGARISYLKADPKADSSSGISPLSTGGSSSFGVSRMVSVSGSMDITDDETFGSNEHGSQAGNNLVSVDDTVPAVLLTMVGVAGEEVRVEVQTNVIAIYNGSVKIEGQIKLYEGTSDQSDDLDGTTNVSFLVPRDRIVNQTFTVRNTDEGGDFATIILTVSNYAA